MRPELLHLGDETQFSRYKAYFDSSCRSAVVQDVLGRTVEFRSSDCRHVCYTTDTDNYNRGKRVEWSQERAERISWIVPTLTAPFEIRPNQVRNRETFLIQMEADPIKNLPQENYCVIVEVIDKNTISFVTAFPHNHAKWTAFRKVGKRIYPVP